MGKQELLNEILGAIQAELQSLGFLYAKDVFKYPLSQEMSGWLGLGTTTNEGPNRVGVYPTVGIVHEGIERLVREFCADENSTARPTLRINMGYLMPENTFLTWIFEPKPFDSAGEINRILQAVELYAIPFMKSHASLKSIISNLEHHRYSDKDSAAYRLPTAYLLAGEADRAASYTKEHLAKLKGRRDIAAQQFESFASKLLEEVSTGK
jgi:hypothetical protein